MKITPKVHFISGLTRLQGGGSDSTYGGRKGVPPFTVCASMIKIGLQLGELGSFVEVRKTPVWFAWAHLQSTIISKLDGNFKIGLLEALDIVLKFAKR